MDFCLNKWDSSYIFSLAENANDERIITWLNEGFPHPYTQKDAEGFIGMVQSDQNALHRAIVSQNRAIGGISLMLGSGAKRFNGELGFWLTPKFWGQGIMTDAVSLFCKEIFCVTKLKRIFAEVFVPNIASCRVLEKCGFSKEGVLHASVFKGGKFYDSVLYALVVSESGKL